MSSPAVDLVDRLIDPADRESTLRILDAILSRASVVELAALGADWTFWARANQIIPINGWRSFGFLMGRGTGKTTTCAKFIVDGVEAGRIRRIGMAAQNEVKTEAVQVNGLIDASPPWFKPESIKNTLVWPNGAIAFAYTPEAPGNIRSENLDLCWLSEMQSWPVATMHEAYLNFQFATRIGRAQTLWDATAKRRHPLLKKLIAKSAAAPGAHVIVGGAIHENRRNLGAGVIADLESEFAGTRAGDEELLGLMTDEEDGALFELGWIKPRPAPRKPARRVIAVDSAVTSKAGSDRTGIIEAALDADGVAVVLQDRSGKHTPPAWAKIVLDMYVKGRCDLVVIETNKAGEYPTQNLRAAADDLDLTVIVVGKDEKPVHTPGVVHVKEVYAKGAKEDRARPVATAYQKERVRHAEGADLSSLVETLTSWVPGLNARSPDDLDALVHAVAELLGLRENKPDNRKAFVGLEVARKALIAPATSRDVSKTLAAVLGYGRKPTI